MKYNIYKEITDKIIRALEEGNFAKWVCPWTNGLPHNALTKHRYKGINQLILGYEQSKKGYNDPRWLTFNQAKRLGGHIKRGEKSTLIVFWKFIEIQETSEDGEEATKRVPVARAYHVFNVEQCDGLDLHPLEKNTFDIDTFTKRLLALPKIQWGGTKACYVPPEDVIRLPQKANFIHAEGFKEVFFHELTHWTGHDKRLARNLKNHFGSAEYAMEELIAELGSAFLMGYIGLTLENTQHVAYLDSWLTVLRKDCRAIFTAARKAQEACDFVLEKAGLQKRSVKLKKSRIKSFSHREA